MGIPGAARAPAIAIIAGHVHGNDVPAPGARSNYLCRRYLLHARPIHAHLELDGHERGQRGLHALSAFTSVRRSRLSPGAMRIHHSRRAGWTSAAFVPRAGQIRQLSWCEQRATADCGVENLPPPVLHGRSAWEHRRFPGSPRSAHSRLDMPCTGVVPHRGSAAALPAARRKAYARTRDVRAMLFARPLRLTQNVNRCSRVI